MAANPVQRLFDRVSALSGEQREQRAVVQFATVRRGTDADPFLFLPLGAIHEGGGLFTLPAGSVWIATSTLDAASPAGAFSGLSIASGEAMLPGLGFLGPGQFHVPADVTCTLDLALPPSDVTPESVTISLAAMSVSVDAPDFAATILDVNLALSRTNDAPGWDSLQQRIAIPFSTMPNQGDVAVARRLIAISGRVRRTRSAWSWPTITSGVPDHDANPSDRMAFLLGDGLRAEWDGLKGGPLRLGECWIIADRTVTALLAERAERRSATHRLTLPETSFIDFAFEQPFRFAWFEENGGLEMLEFEATVSLSLARPLDAAGSRIAYRAPDARVEILDGPLGRTAGFSSYVDDPPFRFFALALENALLSVSSVNRARAELTLSNLSTATGGAIELELGLCHLLPTLPDPYAANFAVRRFDGPRSFLTVGVSWDYGAKMSLSFSVPEHADFPNYLAEPPNWDEEGNLWDKFEHAIGGRPHFPLKLLDLSTNSSQLGIATRLAQRSPIFSGLQLVAVGKDVHIFMVPQVQWEPVRNLSSVPPEKLFSIDDGHQAQIGVRTAHMVPVEPRGAAKQLIDLHNEKGEPIAAIFTLPFGIQAVAAFDLHHLGLEVNPSVVRREIAFGAFDSAWFFRLTAGRPRIATHPPFMPGCAVQHPNILRDEAGPPPAGFDSVLGPMRAWFNDTFGPGGNRPQVPISQIDLSGFGASGQSLWNDEVTPPPTVSQVRFNVHVGRTEREVVQFRTVVWPCQATFVRTITMQRTAAGSVTRHDSGWLATTPGLYQRADSACPFHKGAVVGLFNIREVVETDEILVLASGAKMQAVYFDADAGIRDVVSGQNAQGEVPLRRQKGYIQQVTLGQAGLLTPAELTDLLQRTGPLGGPIDCVVDVGASGQKMRLQGLHGRHGVTNTFFVMLSGSPLWTKRSGEWSVARLYTSGSREGEVEPVDRQRGVPLVRHDGGPWQLADPAEGHVSYALLNASPTHRVLFPAPEIQAGAHAFTSAAAPLIADPYAMVTSAGLFPKSANVIAFPNASYALETVNGGLKLTYPTFTVNRTRELIKTGSWSMRNVYGAGGVTTIDVRIDPDVPVDLLNKATWPIRMDDVSLVLGVPPLGDLLRLVSETPSLGSLPGQLPSPKIVLGPTLDSLKQIISVLDQMHFPAPFKLSVNAAPVDAQTFRVAVSLTLKLATKSGDRIDIGVGKLLGELKVSAELDAGLSSARGRLWLEVGGDLQQGILPPLLYAGGMLRFQIGVDHLGKPDWRLDAGTVASIGGNLIPGLVELEGTVHYAYMLRPDLSPGVRIGMQARAKVLSGLIGIKFGVDAGVTIRRPGTPEPMDLVRLMGDVQVHGSVTVAWVLEPDFSRTMRFQQDLRLRYVAMAAIGGFLPAPL